MNPKDKHADWLLKPTANELADGLAKMYIEKDVNGLFNKRIQNMLRQFDLAESIIKQQQLEIEALKAELAKYGTNGGAIPASYNPYEVPWGVIKEMIDEEIIQTYAEIDGKGIVEFARAILRKAQE